MNIENNFSSEKARKNFDYDNKVIGSFQKGEGSKINIQDPRFECKREQLESLLNTMPIVLEKKYPGKSLEITSIIYEQLLSHHNPDMVEALKDIVLSKVISKNTSTSEYIKALQTDPFVIEELFPAIKKITIHSNHKSEHAA